MKYKGSKKFSAHGLGGARKTKNYFPNSPEGRENRARKK